MENKEFRIIPHIYKWIQENMDGKEASILDKILTIENDTVREEINHSKRVGMSSLGAECIRKKYYDLIGAEKDSKFKSPNSILRLNIGHYYHRLIQYICKQIWGDNCFIEETCYLFDGNEIVSESETDIRIRIEENGINHVFDIKTAMEQVFYNALAKKIPKKYIVQANAYYEATDCDKFSFIFININNCDMTEIPLERDMITGILAKEMAKKLNIYVRNKELPDTPYSTYAECQSGDGRYCDYIGQCWRSEQIKEYNVKLLEEDVFIAPEKVGKTYSKDIEKKTKLKEKIKELDEKHSMKLQKYKDEIKEIDNKWNKYTRAQNKTIIDMGEESDKIVKFQKEFTYKIDEKKLISELGDKIKDYFIVEEKTTPKHLKRNKKNFNLIEEVEEKLFPKKEEKKNSKK